MKKSAGAVIFVLVLAGCSDQQYYAAGQAWQRERCQGIPDLDARERCLAAAALSYEAYQREQKASPPAR